MPLKTSTSLRYTTLVGNQNHVTGYASQHIWCLSQASINWQGCGRNGMQRKNAGMMEIGH